MNNLSATTSQKIDLMRDDYDFVRTRNNPYCDQHKEIYFDLEIWQVKEIKQALIEADDSEFATNEDLAKPAKKYNR